MGIYNERINVLQMRTSPQVQSKIPVEKRPFKVSKIFLNKLASLEDATRTKDRTTHLLELLKRMVLVCTAVSIDIINYKWKLKTSCFLNSCRRWQKISNLSLKQEHLSYWVCVILRKHNSMPKSWKIECKTRDIL